MPRMTRPAGDSDAVGMFSADNPFGCAAMILAAGLALAAIIYAVSFLLPPSH